MGRILKFTYRMVIFFFIIILVPGFPPRNTFPFKAFTIKPADELKGSLEINYHLNGAEKLLEGRVYGPEHLLAINNEIYTGIHGEVIKFNADGATHVAKFRQPCGLAFDTVGNKLIVADIHNGLWEVDLSNGKKKILVSPDQELDGKVKRKAKAFNSVVVDKKGDIYWTDATSDDMIFSIFANPSGRLFHYDRVKNESKCLLDELFYANGVTISPNEEFLLVAESGASRLLKYHLKGPQKGHHSVFIDGLPGCPDNLTPDNKGIWIPLFSAKDADHPSVFAILSEFPKIRMFLSRLLALVNLFLRVMENIFPNVVDQKYIYSIAETVLPLMPKRSTIVRVDWNGNIVESLHGFDKSVGYVSHVLELEDELLLGSPFNSFIAKVKLPKLSQRRSQNVEETSTTTTPRPITTTTTPTTAKTTTAKPSTTSKPATTSPSSTTPNPVPVTKPTPAPTPTSTVTEASSPTKEAVTATTQKPASTTAKPPSEPVKPPASPQPTKTATTQKPVTTTTKPVPESTVKPAVNPQATKIPTTQKPVTTTTKPAAESTVKPAVNPQANKPPTTQKPVTTTTEPALEPVKNEVKPPPNPQPTTTTRTPPKDSTPIVESIPKKTPGKMNDHGAL